VRHIRGKKYKGVGQKRGKMKVTLKDLAALLAPYQQYGAAAVAGLLNSSCCVIQLALNWMSIGCAGFSVLDPLRPVFLTLSYGGLATSLAYAHFYQGKPVATKENLITTLIVTALSLSPELVNAINTRSLPVLSAKPAPEVVRKTVHLNIEGMKCKSCANKVKNAIEAVGNCQAMVFQDESRAEVLCLDSSVTPQQIVDAVTQCTEPPGDFQASVVDKQ
jgi:copper chaperone CopZ